MSAGYSGPSQGDAEASQMRIMNEQMRLSAEQQINAEDRLRTQRETDRLAEKQRLTDAKNEEAAKLVEKNRQETESVMEIYGGAQANSQGNAPNLDAPVIETLETEEDQTRPL